MDFLCHDSETGQDKFVNKKKYERFDNCRYFQISSLMHFDAMMNLMQEIRFEFSKVYSRHLVIETSDGKITLLLSFLENRG